MTTNEPLPIVNTHVHVPPNFSAFGTPSEVIAEAVVQGVSAIGISNFYDQQVYARFGEEATNAGITPLYGLEFITLDAELASEGAKVNDPANPGRVYLCGKGINPFKEKSADAQRIADVIRNGNDERAHEMVRKLADHFAANGVEAGLTPEAVEKSVAQRGDVPVEWVSLQERHVAQAFQEAIEGLPADEQASALERVYGTPASASPSDAVATQGEIRSRLIKTGTPGFVPEVPLSFADAHAYVRAMDGIPCYPILADGAPELSPFEWPPATLAANLRQRNIHLAELIPNRNASEVVDAYVTALNEAGIIVVAGTEHNTLDQIPLDPQCADGPLSDLARRAFFDATCIVAAHQDRVARGEAGYVDADGNVVGDPETARREFAAAGAAIIKN